MVVAVVFGVLAAAGMFVIVSRLWPSGVALLGALPRWCAGSRWWPCSLRGLPAAR
jgi:hypothetical protein